MPGRAGLHRVSGRQRVATGVVATVVAAVAAGSTAWADNGLPATITCNKPPMAGSVHQSGDNYAATYVTPVQCTASMDHSPPPGHSYDWDVHEDWAGPTPTGSSFGFGYQHPGYDGNLEINIIDHWAGYQYGYDFIYQSLLTFIDQTDLPGPIVYRGPRLLHTGSIFRLKTTKPTIGIYAGVRGLPRSFEYTVARRLKQVMRLDGSSPTGRYYYTTFRAHVAAQYGTGFVHHPVSCLRRCTLRLRIVASSARGGDQKVVTVRATSQPRSRRGH